MSYSHNALALALAVGLGACMLPPQQSPSPASPPTAASPGESTMGAPETSAPAASAPAGPQTVSVSIKNECRETVRLFFGDKPKFGSGRYSTLGSNTRTNHTFRPGDMLWIVDESQNGLSSVTVGDSTRDIVILDSCTGMTAR